MKARINEYASRRSAAHVAGCVVELRLPVNAHDEPFFCFGREQPLLQEVLVVAIPPSPQSDPRRRFKLARRRVNKYRNLAGVCVCVWLCCTTIERTDNDRTRSQCQSSGWSLRKQDSNTYETVLLARCGGNNVHDFVGSVRVLRVACEIGKILELQLHRRCLGCRGARTANLHRFSSVAEVMLAAGLSRCSSRTPRQRVSKLHPQTVGPCALPVFKFTSEKGMPDGVPKAGNRRSAYVQSRNCDTPMASHLRQNDTA